VLGLLVSLDGLVLVRQHLGANLGDLVQALHAALDDLGNVDSVVNRRPHSADVHGVELLAALCASLARQRANRVADVHALAARRRDVHVVGVELGSVLVVLLLAHAAKLLAVDPLSHCRSQ